MTLEDALVSVWRQVLEENANLVELAGRRFPVRRTERRRLRQVDFEFEGQALRGIEQNPDTRSRWAQKAREGARVMQFTSGTWPTWPTVRSRSTAARRRAKRRSPRQPRNPLPPASELAQSTTGRGKQRPYKYR